jgi:hypothetical protein
MASVAGPLPNASTRYEYHQHLPIAHRKAPPVPHQQTRFSLLDAEVLKLRAEVAYLTDSIARAAQNLKSALSLVPDGKVPASEKSKFLSENQILTSRIADLHYKISLIREFSFSLEHPTSLISYGVKALVEFEFKHRWTLDLQALRGDSGFNGSIHKAWMIYEMHRDSPDSGEFFKAYKAQDHKRIILEKNLRLLDKYLHVNHSKDIGADRDSLMSLLDYLHTEKKGVCDLECEYESLVSKQKMVMTSLHAISAQEQYDRFLGEQVRLLTRLEEIEPQTMPPTLPTDRIASTKELIEAFEFCWSQTEMKYLSVPYNQSHFIVRAHTYNREFTVKSESDNTIGFIGRKIVETGSQIFVRADLHGDLRSLVENVKKLKELELLSQDYLCRPNVQLIFLGDYMDRGPHSMQVLELLMALRMQNPSNVTLIRGNHETIAMNMHPRMLPSGADENFKAFLSGEQGAQNQKLLDKVYQTLPLAYFIGEKHPEGIQYTMFTHGLFELYADPQEILSNAREQDLIMHIQRAPSGTPDGVKSLFTRRVKDISYEEGKDYPLALRENLDSPSRKKLKLQWAAQRINALALVDTRMKSPPTCTSFYWGDIQEEGLGLEMGNPSERQWKLPTQDVKLYMYLISGPKGKVKLLFRGHEHLKEHHAYTTPEGKEKVVATTMPVGMDSPYTRSFPKQKDTAYIITTAPKVRDWTKSAMERVPGTSLTTMGPVHSLRSKCV